MSFVQTIKENFSHYSEQLKIFIFGENNSRLDKLINRFYSMREEKRKQVGIIGIAAGILIFFLILALYFYGLFQLQRNLDYAADSYIKVQELKPNFVLVKNEYNQIASKLETENTLENLIPAVIRAADGASVEIDSLPENPTLIVMPATSSMSIPFDKAKIDFQIQGISLKRIVDFLNNVHKLPNKFSITKLEISQSMGNKLYFNVVISLEAYVPKQKKG